MKLVTRSQWGAREPRHTSSIGDVQGCTGHWNGPGVGQLRHAQCYEKVRDIQDFHMDVRGWSDIGYSFLVCQHGVVFEGRGLGVRGAHEEDLNADWYGIQATVGQGDEITPELLDGLRDAIRYCRNNGAGDGINAHRDADATACPGDELYAWLHGSPMEDDMPSAREIAHELLHGVKIDDPTRYPKGDGKPTGADDMTVAQILRRLVAESYGRDNVPVPASAAGKDYREQNPTFTGPNAASHGWDAAEKGLDVSKRVAKAIQALAASQDESIRDAVHEALKDVSVTVTYDAPDGGSQ